MWNGVGAISIARGCNLEYRRCNLILVGAIWNGVGAISIASVQSSSVQ